MKSPLVPALLAAIVSSLTTVGLLEVLRAPHAPSALLQPSRTTRAVEEQSPSAPSEPPRDSVRQRPLVDATFEERLAELDRRIAALEVDGPPTRTALTNESAAPPARDELRKLVLDWVNQEREERNVAAKRAAEQAAADQHEFSARYRAHTIALEHGLTSMEEQRLVDVFITVQTKAEELDASIDRANSDPADVEALFEEFDRWAEQYEREQLADLWDRVGDDI